MKSKFTLLILLLAVFASCKKNNDVEVTVSTSGKLTYKMLDDSGKGLPNVKVSLFDNLGTYNNNGAILLDTRLTDQNGLADFGDLNPKTYMVIPDSPMVNNVKYYILDYVQVVTGKTKNKEVKVSDNSGTFNFTVKSNYNNQLLKDIGILMIPYNKFTYQSSATGFFNIADYKGVTNDAGFVSFKVPSNKMYSIYIYNITTNASYGTVNYNTVLPNATINMPLSISTQR